MHNTPHETNHHSDHPQREDESFEQRFRQAITRDQLRGIQAFQTVLPIDGHDYLILAIEHRPIRPPAEEVRREPEWVASFLAHLQQTGSVREATRRAKIARQTAYRRRKTHPAFAHAWTETLRRRKELSSRTDHDHDGHECNTSLRASKTQ